MRRVLSRGGILLLVATVTGPWWRRRRVPEEVVPNVRRVRGPAAGYVVVLLLVMSAVVVRADRGSAGAYGIVLLLLLVGKAAASARHRDVVGPVGGVPLDVVAVVPYYNEDPTLLVACLRSMAGQSRLPRVVYVVDDGSTDAAARAAVDRVLPELAPLHVVHVVAAENRGKREALAVAFRAEPDADVYVTIDSDTRLEPDALERLLAAFARPDVTAATGLVLAMNHDVNVLTRLIDVRYVNAFLFERAAYGAFGSVLCACGSLAAYRADVVHEHLDDFLGQRFLGAPAVFGDDRRLTNYALMSGRVVMQADAVASTAVPERFGHYVRQQLRWNKSFFRESAWGLLNFPLSRPAFWLTFLELSSWIVLTGMMLVVVVLHPVLVGKMLLGVLLFWIALMGWARSMYYLEVRRSGQGAARRVGTLLIAPIYGLMTLVLLVPLRVWSLLTIKRTAWGTRASVEVSVPDAAAGRGRDPVHHLDLPTDRPTSALTSSGATP